MGMPSGDSPQTAQSYYHYLQAHQETMQRAATWHVRWLDLAWLWGFVIVLSLIAIWWIWQYRSTRQKGGIYPTDSFGGYTTELAGPATLGVNVTLIAHEAPFAYGVPTEQVLEQVKGPDAQIGPP